MEYVCRSISPPACLCCLFACVCRSIYLCVSACDCRSVCPPACLGPSVCLWLSINLSARRPVSLCLSACVCRGRDKQAGRQIDQSYVLSVCLSVFTHLRAHDVVNPHPVAGAGRHRHLREVQQKGESLCSTPVASNDKRRGARQAGMTSRRQPTTNRRGAREGRQPAWAATTNREA